MPKTKSYGYCPGAECWTFCHDSQGKETDRIDPTGQMVHYVDATNQDPWDLRVTAESTVKQQSALRFLRGSKEAMAWGKTETLEYVPGIQPKRSTVGRSSVAAKAGNSDEYIITIVSVAREFDLPEEAHAISVEVKLKR